MDFTRTSTKAPQAGTTLAEYVIAVAIGSVLLVTMAALSIFGARSFATTNDFVDLDQASRLALDTMSQEIRQADRVVNCSSNQITFQSGATTINYSFSPSTRTVTRVKNGQTRTLLQDCDYARYDMFQRNATNGTYDYYPTADTNTCKVVQLTWACSKTFLGPHKHTAIQQSAKVVIRKQK